MFLPVPTGAPMPRLKSKSDNSLMGHGGSITRIKSSRNILQQSFESRFVRSNILDTSKVLSLTNGFIGRLLRRRKFFRHRGHEQHEIGFFEGISTYGDRIKLKHNQGDIFAVQLRGHIDVA